MRSTHLNGTNKFLVEQWLILNCLPVIACELILIMLLTCWNEYEVVKINTRFVKTSSAGTARYCACALSRWSASVVHGGDVMIPPSRRQPTRCVPVKWRSAQLHTFSQARGRHSSISLMIILLVISYCGLITMSETPTKYQSLRTACVHHYLQRLWTVYLVRSQFQVQH